MSGWRYNPDENRYEYIDYFGYLTHWICGKAVAKLEELKSGGINVPSS